MLYSADTQEESLYFYIPLTKDVVKRATFTKCEVYTESIIRALLQQYHDEIQAAAKFQRPSYDLEPLSSLSLETALAKRTATIATTQDMSFRVGDASHAEGFDFTDDYLDTYAAAVDCEIIAASTATSNEYIDIFIIDVIKIFRNV